MDAQCLRLVIESKLENVSLVGTTVQQICLQASLDETEAFQVQLAIVEAVNNIIKHAYNNRPGNKVKVDISILPDRLMFKLIDKGSAKPDVTPPSLDFDPEDIDAIPESGMGLFIIQNVMDEVDYRSLKNKNVQTLIKHL